MLRENGSGKNELARFRESIFTIYKTYLKRFPNEEERLHDLFQALSQQKLDISLSTTAPEGHISASGIIVSHDLSKILMTLDKKLGTWVIPGGHYDKEDQTLENTALRQTSKETSIPDLSLHPWHVINGIPLDIDTHILPEDITNGENEHKHFEFRYILTAPLIEEIAIDPRELLGIQWIGLEEIDPHSNIAPATAKLDLLQST